MRWIACLLILFANQAFAVEIKSLRLASLKDSVIAYIGIEGDLADTVPAVEFINETVQFDLPGATVKGGEIKQNVKDSKIQSLYAYQLDDETARIRIQLNSGVKADTLRKLFKLEAGNQGLEAKLDRPNVSRQPTSITANVKPNEMYEDSKVAKNEFEDLSDSEIEQQLRAMPVKSVTAPTTSQPQSQAGSVAGTTSVMAEKNEISDLTKAEASTPVFVNADKKQTRPEATSPLKSILGLAFVALALVTLYWAVQKWFVKKNQKNPHTNIRILTQHYLGPKKSLAIISVAGESILIGITDHNINLIKSLSLLDGEIPGQMSENFESSLEQAEAQDQSEDDYAVKGIREIVAGRLKGMRDLL